MIDPYGPGEFVCLAQTLMKSNGDLAATAYALSENHPRQTRIIEICKSAIGAGSLSDPTWSGNLAPYQQVSTGFLESLRSLSVFDRLLGDVAIQRVPLRTRLSVVIGSAIASEVGESVPAPVGRMSLTGQTIQSLKVLAIVVLNNEIVLNTSTAAMAMLSRELRGAVATATDKTFLTQLATGVTPIASVGATAANVLTDIGKMLESVAPRSGSRLYLVADPINAMRLSVMTASDGRQAFANMTYAGGEIAGLPVLVSDQLPAASMMLIDGAGIAGDSDVITLDASEEAALQMDTSPDNPVTEDTTMVSLWQHNQRAIKCERFFGFQKVRPHPVAILSGVDYQ